MKVHKVPPSQQLRILLTNGRFPVALDLARQLRKVGHKVFTVDSMRYNITTFSKSVDKCFKVAAPHDDAAAYIAGIIVVVNALNIQLIIPMHEEVCYLAQAEELKPLLFAPPFHMLIALHNKWSFYELVTKAGLTAPASVLCRSMDDVMKLDLANKEYALKPVFGRALSGMYHLRPGQILPEINFQDTVPYVAQEWIYGKQMCSYAVARNGEIKASAIYPVIDTIDGSSCVFFQSVEHPKIRAFMEILARKYNITGQIAFDFIDTPDILYPLECNPRATSGIHLFNKTPLLVDAFTNPLAPYHKAPLGKKVQMIPGMLMWENTTGSKRVKVQHMRRLFGTHDILFSISDPAPALMQPFLYATYVKLCRAKKLQLKELFQWDLIWEPTQQALQRAQQEALTAGDIVAWAAYGVPLTSTPTIGAPSSLTSPFASNSEQLKGTYAQYDPSNMGGEICKPEYSQQPIHPYYSGIAAV